MSRPAKTIILVISVLLALAAQAGSEAGREQHRDSTSVELADDRGYLVVVPRQPRRIISLTVFTDDILVELVDHRRILGLTNFSSDPAISNVAGKIADIPHRLTLNPEVIIALQPDLVFVANWS
jgi:iron complex transport system substrate-binding protein